jgi:hypothetical protein
MGVFARGRLEERGCWVGFLIDVKRVLELYICEHAFLFYHLPIYHDDPSAFGLSLLGDDAEKPSLPYKYF